MKIKYIAKPNTYFDEGTEAFLVEDAMARGLYARFRGIRYGEMKVELCKFSEFEEVYDDSDDN